jgi:FAD-linked sulfhydryl oxidase
MGLPSGPSRHKNAVTPMAAMGVLDAVSKENNGYPKDCPADVEQLGRSSWTLLHTMAARYPVAPTAEQQNDMSSFIGLFAKLYPCWFCANDFKEYIQKDKPKVQTQEEFGKWLCDAHNEVNKKLGKKEFDCNLWKQRWKDGWGDDRC